MKVLIIDDDDVNNFLCKKIMELCDFSNDIHACKSAQEGIDYLKSIKDEQPDQYPDLLFLDINMPISNGWDFLDTYNNWTADTTKDTLKIFMLSSSVYEADIARAEEHPLVTKYITKPISKETLMLLK